VKSKILLLHNEFLILISLFTYGEDLCQEFDTSCNNSSKTKFSVNNSDNFQTIYDSESKSKQGHNFGYLIDTHIFWNESILNFQCLVNKAKKIMI
jgi:hypothetical protein